MILKNLNLTNVKLNSNMLLNHMRNYWIDREFDGEFKSFRKNSDDTYTMIKLYHNPSNNFDSEEILLNCKPHQNKVFQCFDILLNLKL